MSDPNQPYKPQPYPKALYRDHGTMRVVANEEEHAEAASEGYVEFADLGERPKDDLELMTHDQLVDVLIGQLRKLAQGRSRDELLQMARVQRDIEVHNATVAEFEARQQAAVDEAVVALGGEPGEDPDHVLYGHSTIADTVKVGEESLDAGQVVMDVFSASGLSDEEWNDLPTATRDTMIVEHLKSLGWVEPAPEATIDLDAESEDSALVLATDAPAAPQAEPEAVTEQPAEEPAEAAAAPAEIAADPLDHDKDGEKGGAVEVSDAVVKLRADLDALGVAYDGRWREARLTKALDEATKA